MAEIEQLMEDPAQRTLMQPQENEQLEQPKEEFIKSATWAGAKPGYAFKTGKQGTGYYVDNGPRKVLKARDTNKPGSGSARKSSASKEVTTPKDGATTPASGRGGSGRLRPGQRLGGNPAPESPADVAAPKGGAPRIIDLYAIGAPIYTSPKTGNVFHVGQHRLTGREVAMKVVSKKKMSEAAFNKFNAMTANLEKVQHPHIAHLLECFDTGDHFILVQEKIEGCTLAEFMQDNGLTEEETCAVFQQLAPALLHCHNSGLCHRDIRLQNVMLKAGSSICIKLIDFTQSIKREKKITKGVSALPYMPPECFTGGEYDGAKADVWSLGVLLYIMLAGTFPFNSEDATMQGEPEYPEHISAEAKALLKAMFNTNAQQRIHMADVCRHAWTTTQGPQGKSPVAAEAPKGAGLDASICKQLEGLGLSVSEVEQSVKAGDRNSNSTAYWLLQEKAQQKKLKQLQKGASTSIPE